MVKWCFLLFSQNPLDPKFTPLYIDMYAGCQFKRGDAFCSASLPDDYRCGKSLGPVESIQEHPQQPGKLLIGYSRGLVILWALGTRQAEQLFLGKQVAV